MNKMRKEILLLVLCMGLTGVCIVCYNNKISSMMEPVFVIEKGVGDSKELYIKVKVLEGEKVIP